MRRFAAAKSPLILLLVVTGFFWKLLTKQYTWMDHPDMAYQVLPWFQFQAAAWHRGEFPTWDPHVWGGQPLIGQMQPGAAYPPNWLLFLLPLKDGRIQWIWLHLDFIVTHFLAALFCYWLCSYLGRTRSASMLAGIAFALTGVVGSIGWPQMLNGAIWIPLVVLFFLRSIRGERPLTDAALSGTMLGISFLSGHHQIPTFTALLMMSLWVVEIWKRRLNALKPVGVFLLFASLVSAFQTLPAYATGVRSIRWVGSENPVFWGQYVPYSVHQQFSLSPLGVLGLLLPGATDQSAFIGLAIFALALMGLAAGFRKAFLSHPSQDGVRLFAAIASGGLLFALGGSSVFHGLAYLLIPMVEKARTPEMAIVIVQFALSVLAAYGLDAFRAMSGWWTVSLAAIGILPWPMLAILSAVRPEASREYQHLAILAMVALALAVVLHCSKSRYLSPRTAVALIFVVVLFEIGTVTGQNYRHRESPGGFLAELDKNDDIVNFLRHRPDFVRLEVDTDAVPYNIGDWDGIDQFRCYLGGMTTNVAAFEVDRLAGGRLAPMLFALNYFLGRKPLRPEQEPVFVGKAGVTVYRNPEAFPRAWIVHEAISVSDKEVMARLRTTELRRQVVLTDAAPKLETCAGNDDVLFLRRDDTHDVLETRMQCKGMVILSATFFPGWQALVDGRQAHLYEAYGALRGVVVDAGTHRVEFRYRPTTVYCGAILTALGLLAALLLAFWRTRRYHEEPIAGAASGA